MYIIGRYNFLVVQKDNFVKSNNLFQILLTKHDNRYYIVVQQSFHFLHRVESKLNNHTTGLCGKCTNGTLPDFYFHTAYSYIHPAYL